MTASHHLKVAAAPAQAPAQPLRGVRDLGGRIARHELAAEDRRRRDLGAETAERFGLIASDLHAAQQYLMRGVAAVVEATVEPTSLARELEEADYMLDHARQLLRRELMRIGAEIPDWPQEPLPPAVARPGRTGTADLPAGSARP